MNRNSGTMGVLPPGTLLQLMYLEEWALKKTPGLFIEVGPGSGNITHTLLDLGWRGRVFELDTSTASVLRSRFSAQIASSQLTVINESYLRCRDPESVDLIISSMVMEHLSDSDELAFMVKSASLLKSNGVMVAIVPSSPAHWGIEDDIAGHFRRYTRTAIDGLMTRAGWRLNHVAGLTFPVSNLLLPLSNVLVRRAEISKLKLSVLERTKQSGRRAVRFKTEFPSLARIVLNRLTLWPVHVLQKVFASSSRCLVLFFECQPLRREGE